MEAVCCTWTRWCRIDWMVCWHVALVAGDRSKRSCCTQEAYYVCRYLFLIEAFPNRCLLRLPAPGRPLDMEVPNSLRSRAFSRVAMADGCRVDWCSWQVILWCWARNRITGPLGCQPSKLAGLAVEGQTQDTTYGSIMGAGTRAPLQYVRGRCS